MKDTKFEDKTPSHGDQGLTSAPPLTQSVESGVVDLSRVKQGGEEGVRDKSFKTKLMNYLHIGTTQQHANLANPVSDKISGTVRDVTLTANPEDIISGESTLLLLDNPEIEKTDRLTSFDVVAQLQAAGASVEEVPLNLYREKQLGAPKSFSWETEFKGYPNLYESVDHMKEVVARVKKLARRFAAKTELIYNDPNHPQHLIALSEWPDTQAIGMIRLKSLGWFLEPVFSLDIRRLQPSVIFERVLRTVAKRYADAIRQPVPTDHPDIKTVSLSTSDEICRLLDSDPTDTLVGLPTMNSAEKTMPTRLRMLNISPSFKNLDGTPMISGLLWFQKYVKNVSAQLGIPPYMVSSVSIANRTSASRKSFRLWTKSPAGYSSSMSVKGLGARVRNVFPVPFVINYALSPLYVQLSHARKNIPGLWHDPDSWKAMLNNLTNDKSKVILSADFSGMDQHMAPSVISMVGNELYRAGFSKFASSLTATIQNEMSILAPSMLGTPKHVTKINGVIPWLSGFKLTSEIDTIYGLAATLSALSMQKPTKNIVDDWVKGKFIIYELGDDTIFAMDRDVHAAVDWDKFTDDAFKLVGADIKRDDAPVFLKKIILQDGRCPRMLSRVIQQTFFNESRSDGLPEIVALVGLRARMEGIDQHPWYEEFRLEFEDILMTTHFAKFLKLTRADLAPSAPMRPDLMQQLIDYASSLTGLDWLGNLREQAKYSHAAAEALNSLPPDLLQRTSSVDRKLYQKAIDSTPLEDNVLALKLDVSNYLA